MAGVKSVHFFPQWVLKSRKKKKYCSSFQTKEFQKTTQCTIIKAFSNAFGHPPNTVRISSKQHWVKIMTIKKVLTATCWECHKTPINATKNSTVNFFYTVG